MFRIYAKAQHIIYAGHRGENLARCICFPLTDMQTEFGIGTWDVVFQRPGEALPYIVQNKEEVEQYAVWGLDDTDTAIAGEGRCELRYYVNDVLCKTVVFPTVITPSLGITGDIPDPYEDLLNNVHEDVQLAASSADRAAENADRAAGYIDGSDVTDAVRWDVSQFLSVNEQGRGRANINAANAIVESAEGSVASFADGADSVPMASVVAQIEPIQSGSGDPSPSNVRPIPGRNSVEVTRTGKNLLDTSNAETVTRNGVSFVKNSDGSITASGTSTADWQSRLFLGYLPSGSYELSGGISSSVRLRLGQGSGNTLIGHDSGSGLSFTLTEETLINVNIRFANGADANVTIYPMIRLASETDATFAPYNAQTYTTALGQTVYGGTLDLVSGVLTITHGNIASYAGETLPGEWISSMDVYTPGGTPTTGSQVVYELATPQTVQLTPTEITSLFGGNVLWADSGSVAVTYRADLKTYIDNRIETLTNAIISLGGNV